MAGYHTGHMSTTDTSSNADRKARTDEITFIVDALRAEADAISTYIRASPPESDIETASPMSLPNPGMP